MAKKLSKVRVNYRPAPRAVQRCGSCVMFRAPDACTLVAGYIRRVDVCDRWTPKT